MNKSSEYLKKPLIRKKSPELKPQKLQKSRLSATDCAHSFRDTVASTKVDNSILSGVTMSKTRNSVKHV